MRHLDLFSGIGGFALAAKWAWGDEYEIVAFCEIDKFCHKVLRKNFGDVPIYEDIKQFRITTHADNGGHTGAIREALSERERETLSDTELSGRNIRRSSVYRQGETERIIDFTGIDLLTGGFPCQPFSVAGKRKGNEDDRALWPEMLRVVQEVKPRWIVGENVSGFVNMALDQSITDLENEGYEVQAFIIPACALNAPHRRDRVWIVANNNNAGNGTPGSGIDGNKGWSKLTQPESIGQTKVNANAGCEYGKPWRDGRVGSGETLRTPCESDAERCGEDARNTQGGSDRLYQAEHEGWQVDTNGDSQGLQRLRKPGNAGEKREKYGDELTNGLRGSWNENWYEAATRFCRVDDGVPNRVDRLKGLGNAIVPQVAYEIFKAINECHVR